MIFCHHFSFMEEIYFWRSLRHHCRSAFQTELFKNEMEAHYLRKNCLCLPFPLLHLPPLQILQSVLCGCYFFMMVVTPADSSLLCICYLPRSICDCWHCLPPDSLLGFQSSSLYASPLTSHITSSTFLLEKSFILFAPLSLVFTRISFWFLSSRYMTTKHQTRK